MLKASSYSQCLGEVKKDNSPLPIRSFLCEAEHSKIKDIDKQEMKKIRQATILPAKGRLGYEKDVIKLL